MWLIRVEIMKEEPFKILIFDTSDNMYNAILECHFLKRTLDASLVKKLSWRKLHVQ